MITFSRGVEKGKKKSQNKCPQFNNTSIFLLPSVREEKKNLIWAFGSGNSFALLPEACGFSLASLESWPRVVSPSLVLIKLCDGFWITFIPRGPLVSPPVDLVVHSRLQWSWGQRSLVTPTAQIRLSLATQGMDYRAESGARAHRTKAIAPQLFPN